MLASEALPKSLTSAFLVCLQSIAGFLPTLAHLNMATQISYRSRWARQLIREKLSAEINKLQNQNQHVPLGVGLQPTLPVSPDDLPEDPRPGSGGNRRQQHALPADSKVCIVGAGVSGLYIAMILDDLAIPNLSYQILEASDRVGGRMYTHKFTETPHDYYDIGAMRYPRIKIMDRTFDLFKRLDVPLIPYFLDDGSVKTPSRYNDVVSIQGETPPVDNDTYKVSISNGGSVPDATIKKGVGTILDEAFGPYKEAMQNDWTTGFYKLLKEDNYSTRQYLRERMNPGYDFFSIQWMETINTASGLFDQAFSESVIDSFDFDAPGGHEEWTCILGGTGLVSEAMQQRIKGRIERNKRVHNVFIDHNDLNDANMRVKCSDEPTPRDPYVTVFNTTSLGCLQRMDLTGLDLHPTQKDAIRVLHYDDSAKVAIKFTYPWWIQDCGITSGGSGPTDIPLRTCVYPSYNLHDLDKKAVLLCSYTWSQDATRVGSLVSRDSPQSEAELIELMFDDLAKLHELSFGGKTRAEIRALISKAYVTHHAFSWSHDPFTSGAFALVRFAMFICFMLITFLYRTTNPSRPYLYSSSTQKKSKRP